MKLRTAYEEVFNDPDCTWLAKILLCPTIFLLVVLFVKEPEDDQ